MNRSADCNLRKGKSPAILTALHVLVVVLLFSLLLVARREPGSAAEFPMLPGAVTASGPGSYFSNMMADVAGDQWLYYSEARYLLRGEIDPAFDEYKKVRMDGEGLKPPEPGRIRLPYRDISLEYPPLAAVFIVLPAMFASDLYAYKLAYSLLASAFFLAALVTVMRASERHRSSLLAASLAFTVCFGPLLVSRLDVFAVFFVTLALSLTRAKRHAWAGTCLALGIAVKVYPAVFLPFFLLEACRSRSWKGGFRMAFGFAAAMAAVYAPVLALSPEGYLKSLAYHADRGVEIESLWATWAQARHLLSNVPAESYVRYGSVNLAWSGEAWVKDHWTLFALTALAAVGLSFLARTLREKPDRGSEENGFLVLNVACLAAVSALMVTSKVLSAQYVLWLYPFLLWAGLGRAWLWALCGGAALGTQILYPYLFNDLIAFEPLSVFLIALRNGILALLYFAALVPVAREAFGKPVFEGVALENRSR